MNALCYKIVFSKRLGALVAVGEHTAGQGKAAGTGVRTAVYPSSAVGAKAGEFVGSLKAVFASVALTCFTATTIAAGPATNTLPTGYSVNSGNVAISTTGSTMNIHQATDKASVNWNSFSIGSGAAVNVQQNSASSVLLNRVVGNDPSQIFGKLTANGQVILINPNGIVFGKGGSVTASAFTASTFGMTDADFQAGKHKFSRNGSTRGVTVEEGADIHTTTPGGYVALIGASVNNQGEIHTQQGAVVMAAGESVALPTALTDSVGVPLSSKVRLELAPSTINASVENGGTITTDGGQVLMQAAAVADAVASITHTGTIDTTGEQGGAVTLQADHGIIKATGKIKANSNNAKNKGGDIIIGRDDKVDPITSKTTTVLAKATDVRGAKLESQGGFVETSGDWLDTKGVTVLAKDWLLDPADINIVNDVTAESNNWIGQWTDTRPKSGVATTFIRASTISEQLNRGTNVTITTTNSEVAGTGQGNITVSHAIVKNSSKDSSGNLLPTGTNDASLKLIADNGITLDAEISSTSGKLDVTLIAKGEGSIDGARRGITLNKMIDANGGKVVLEGTTKNTALTGGWRTDNRRLSGVVFNNGSGIKAGTYEVTGKQDGTGSWGIAGVVFNGNNVELTSTAGNSFVKGFKESTNSNVFGNGVHFIDGSKLTVDSGTSSGTALIWGTNTRTSTDGGGSTILTKGNVTLESQGNMTLRAGTVKAELGTLSVKGSSVELYNTGAHLIGADNATVNLNSTGDMRLSLPGESGGTLSVGRNATLNITAGGLLHTFRDITADKNGGTINIDAGSINLSKGNNDSSRTISGNDINIKAKNIIFSNVKIDAENKLNVTGTGAGTAPAINVTGVSSLDSNGTTSLTGSGGNGAGVSIGASASVKGGAVNITGTTDTANNGVFNAGTIEAKTTDVQINGISKTGGGTTLQGAVTGKRNVSISGTSTSSTSAQGLVIQNTVTATDGSITVTAETPSTQTSAALAITANSSVNGHLITTNGGDININTDTLLINQNSTVKAGSNGTGTGTVNIDTTTRGNNIALGAEDVLSPTPESRTLGLVQIELQNITANKLVIGNSIYGGSIKIASAIDVKHIDTLSLQTQPDKTVTQALTGSIQGKKLEVVSGTVTLNNPNNNITTLAAKAASVNFVNNGALIIGEVNGTNGVATTGGASVITRTGNLTINENVTNTDTDPSDVILGAGTDADANQGLDSNIKVGNTAAKVSNTSTGKTFLYTGSTAGTDTLVDLNDSLANLDLSAIGSGKQNADSNVTFKTDDKRNIIEDGADIQVMFREKIAIGSLTGVEVERTYGDANTQNTTPDQLLAYTKTQWKNSVSNTTSVVTGKAAGTIRIANTALIDALDNPSLSSPAYSASGYLNAKDDAYKYNTLNSSKYDTRVTGLAVKVIPKTLTLLGTTVADKPFDGNISATVTNNGTLNGLVGNETLNVTATGTFNNSSVGNQKPVAITGALANGTGLASNYRVAPASAVANITEAVKPPVPVVPTDGNSRVKIPVGSGNPFALASAEDLADDTCSANSIENCHCEASPLNANVDICYEPKAGAKGTAR